MSQWESTLSSWTRPASDAEEARYDWTRRQVRDALSRHVSPQYSFDVYAKGSYPNFTNVVRDSDVDIAVELTNMFDFEFVGAASGMTPAEAGFSLYTGSLTLAGFKHQVEGALRSQFGSSQVTRGSKAFHVRATSAGLAADVVACKTHRCYRTRSPSGYERGVRLLDDDDPTRRIVNYPKQHLAQGITKNDLTHRRYKRVVRILKRLENKLVEERRLSAVPSFLIESATWNTPSTYFNTQPTWSGRVKAVLGHVYQGCSKLDAESSSAWLEANGIKYLFHDTQSWRREDITRFCQIAWDYLGLS